MARLVQVKIKYFELKKRAEVMSDNLIWEGRGMGRGVEGTLEGKERQRQEIVQLVAGVVKANWRGLLQFVASRVGSH